MDRKQVLDEFNSSRQFTLKVTMSTLMFRLILSGFTVVWLCASSFVFAAETKIGSSDIFLPEIDGFQLITRDTPGLHPIASRLTQDCDGKQCGIYAGVSGRADSVARTWEAFEPLYTVQILDDDLVVRSGEFPALMQRLKADTKGMRANTALSVTELKIDVNIDSPEGSELVFLDVSAEVSEEFYETETYLAIPVYGEVNYKGKDESIARYAFDAVVGFVLVRDKILLTMLFVPKNDIVWSRLTFEKVVKELVQANLQKGVEGQ